MEVLVGTDFFPDSHYQVARHAAGVAATPLGTFGGGASQGRRFSFILEFDARPGRVTG
jgi:hypothetical protein